MLPESELDHDNLIQHLIEAVACSACGAPYETKDVHVIAQDDDAWTLVAFCPECGEQSIVLAYIDLVTNDDVEPPDLREVAAWGRFLAQFDGDLYDLLQY